MHYQSILEKVNLLSQLHDSNEIGDPVYNFTVKQAFKDIADALTLKILERDDTIYVVKVIKAEFPQYWYAKHIGREFKVKHSLEKIECWECLGFDTVHWLNKDNVEIIDSFKEPKNEVNDKVETLLEKFRINLLYTLQEKK